VQIALPKKGLEGYKSNSQRARIATELWAQQNLYCASCDCASLHQAPANMPAVDLDCLTCGACFQLKAQSRPFSGRIVDAAYSAMVRAIRENRTPNLLALQYDLPDWTVANLFLIPSFAFPLSAIEKRNALGPHARRAGWVGCNILLDSIPADARISMVRDRKFVSARAVREQYLRVLPFKRLPPEKRGWTLDVLNILRRLGKSEFKLADVYTAEEELARLHPANRHVRDKIRQQLQELRDLGFVQFLGAGEYRLP
jgi:type II restriction enzyme